MPPQNPQAVLRDSNGNRVGTFYRTGDGRIALHDDISGKEITVGPEGFTVDTVRTSSYPVADVTAHGAEGDGVTDDTTPIYNTINAASSADGAGAVYFPPGEYLLNDAITVPSGLTIRGAGPALTTIKSTNTAEIETFIPESHVTLGGFTCDQNAAGRSQSWTTGIHIQDVDHCLVDNVHFENVSTVVNGSGVFFEVVEEDTQDTHSHLVHNCRFVGDNQDSDNGGDFLIRGRTAFGGSLPDDQYTRFLRDIHIDNCYFTGSGKSAIELVGPATRQNKVSNCVARNFTSCVGAFEASLGAKDNTFTNCYVVDSTGDSGLIGFYSDGYQGTSITRYSEDNSFVNCHVRNCQETQTGSYIRGFRTRLDHRAKFSGCTAKNITAPTSELASGFDITQSENVTIESPMVRNVHRGVRLNSATLPRINDALFDSVTDLVYEETTTDRPRWNGVLGGGEFGGVNLSTTSGYYPRDIAMSNDNMFAVWTGSQWKKSDGTLVG